VLWRIRFTLGTGSALAINRKVTVEGTHNTGEYQAVHLGGTRQYVFIPSPRTFEISCQATKRTEHGLNFITTLTSTNAIDCNRNLKGLSVTLRNEQFHRANCGVDTFRLRELSVNGRR